MKITELKKDFESLRAMKVKQSPGYWVALCPKCGKRHGSGSERSVIPTLVFCDHKK